LPERGRQGPAASFHGRQAVVLIAAASQARSSPPASGTLARLWLAAALAAFFLALLLVRLAGGLDRRPAAPPVPHEIKLSLR
jgi:hypothetical protein